MKKCLIIANGELPKKSDFNFLRKKGYTTIYCADGGANSAFKLNIIPDIIIGDLDSVKKEVLNYYKSKSKIKKINRQDDTDVEKAIKFAIAKNFTEVILLGATGDRLDHTFGNLSIALKYSDDINLSILHKKSFLTIVENNVLLDTIPNETISIYGFDKKTKISSRGLKYELKNSVITFGVRESTSNQAVGNEVNLTIKNGKIFLIREFEALKKNDYFN